MGPLRGPIPMPRSIPSLPIGRIVGMCCATNCCIQRRYARKFGGDQPEQARELKQRARQDDVSTPWWQHLGSSDEFEQKIMERMGTPFYREVFQPAIQKAWDAGQSYEDIRDTLRDQWNAQRTSGKKRARETVAEK